MLTSLHIRNYVLIDALEVTFPPEGLVILTGETGAGKSILLGALSLLTGARADAGVVGVRGDQCVVEAEFDVSGDDRARALAEAEDLEWEGGILTVRRTVSRNGRSRAFVNDSPVAVAFLQEMGRYLVDIHAQHQSLQLQDSDFRLRVLDGYARSESTLSRCREAWAHLKSLEKELADVTRQIRQAAERRDYDEAVWEKLDKAQLKAGELPALEEEQLTLAHAEEIRQRLGAAAEAFSPREGAGLTASLKEASKALSKISGFLPAVAPLVERMESSRLELEDIEAEIDALSSGVDVSPERLERVEERLSLLYGLMSRHGVSSVEELIAIRDRLGESVNGSEALEDRKKALQKEIDAAQADYDALCGQLHQSREAAAGPFAESVVKSLRFLELEKATFRVQVEETTPGPSGRDAVRFLFSATGKAPVDVAKGASGGELSRIMLSLKALMARFTKMPTLVFDEIDTGVSGSAADKMGSMICAMGDDMQVFAITHLPQVAAKGSVHYLVSKDTSGEDAVTSIRRIAGEDRIREIARMLSGARITPEAIANAQALLSPR